MLKRHWVIIDTNLWISFLLTGKYDFLDHLLISGAIRLVFCRELLNEFMEVINRPKLRKYFTEHDLEI